MYPTDIEDATTFQGFTGLSDRDEQSMHEMLMDTYRNDAAYTDAELQAMAEHGQSVLQDDEGPIPSAASHRARILESVRAMRADVQAMMKDNAAKMAKPSPSVEVA